MVSHKEKLRTKLNKQKMLLAAKKNLKCVGCGCTQHNPCYDNDARTCTWVFKYTKGTKGICSLCLNTPGIMLKYTKN
jgi:hypothetical protein